MSSFSENMMQSESQREEQSAGSLAYDVLESIELLMPRHAVRTAETGCGRSTILFSNMVKDHTAFCLDDTSQAGSSVTYCRESELFKTEHVGFVLGPTQQTLPSFNHRGKYDCVLIDGPHGYPFPDIEYFYFYPLVNEGGLLIIDDIQIASIGRMADILQEDAMWELLEVVKTTAIFRRTSAPTFSTTGDDWWTQKYNQRRTEPWNEFRLEDGKMLEPFERKAEKYYNQESGRRNMDKVKARLKGLFGI